MRGARATLSFRAASPDDATAVAGLYATVGQGLPGAPASPGEFERLIQTGSAFLVAVADERAVGAVRFRDEEGITWMDLLVAGRAGAGTGLLRAAERGAQDRGARLVRMRVPASSRLPAAFGWFGYLPVAREEHEGDGWLVLEKRLPLLTVREQRREDAETIAELTGTDAWPFAQGRRPGWFVLADGERVAGAVSVRIGRDGVASVSRPTLKDGYRGRGLEVWMMERCATHAATNGARTVTIAATPELDAERRGLEERGWERSGGAWRKELSHQPLE